MRRRVTVVALSVCLSVCYHSSGGVVWFYDQTTVCGASTFYSLHLQLVDFQKNCFVYKLWRDLLTMTDSGGIAGTFLVFFPDGGGF